MKATTFVLRQHQRIEEMLRVLERERHVRAPMLTHLVEEMLSFLALEEHLFYPRVARTRTGGDDRLREARDRISEEHAALLDLLDAEGDDEFARCIRQLFRVVEGHAKTDRAIVPIAERTLAEPELEELGSRMARFYRESVTAAHRPSASAAR